MVMRSGPPGGSSGAAAVLSCAVSWRPVMLCDVLTGLFPRPFCRRDHYADPESGNPGRTRS